MTWQTWTALFFVFIVVLCVAYDLIAYSLGGNPATISRVCLECANANRGFTMLVAFAVGVLFGHLFLPQHQ